MKVPFRLVVLGCLLAPPASAAMFGPDSEPCSDALSTALIVECTAAKTRTWDTRLNRAYAALAAAVDPPQREPLKAAQRLWLQFRDSNCRFYADHEGTFRLVLAAECLRSMTEDRAKELEVAAKPQG